MKISSHWFLDANYSDEFEELLEELKTNNNLDELLEKHIEKIFYPEEKASWIQKLIMSAYIKYSIGKDDEASLVYGLSQDERLLEELFKSIIKRSIYEYLMTIKYNKDITIHHLSDSEIELKIQYIEEKWVKNV